MTVQQAAVAWSQNRELEFRSERTADTKAAVMAMPSGYNDFTRRRFAQELRSLAPVEVQIGRESSPVAYLHFAGPAEAQAAFKRAELGRFADEIQIGADFVLRLWWD